MNKFRLFLLSLAMGSTIASAADYTDFYIFGDSLSDGGNTPNPEPFNLEGRFSNGKVWNEYLAEMLDMPIPIKSDSAKQGEETAAPATNYARGGAMTHHGPTELSIPSVFQQIQGKIMDKSVGHAREGENFDATDLVSIWAGANNLFFSGQTQIRGEFENAALRAANEQLINTRMLMAKGAKTVLIFNLPDIGKTPSYAGDPEGAAQATKFSVAYNKRMLEVLDILQKENPDAKLIPIDMEAIFTMLFNEPEKHGFADSSSQLIKVLAENPQADASKYVFYDDVHPTTAAHKFIAEQIYAALNGEQ